MSSALLLCLVGGSAAAQAPRRGEPLAERMHRFLDDVMGAPEATLAAYFPRRDDWTWYHTVHEDGAPDRMEVWRFPASATLDAIRTCGPAWESFQFQPEGQPVGVLSWQVLDHGRQWRRVSGTRFVPPGAPARGPVFVEWRREDGTWVVSAFGDESFRGRPLRGTVAGTVRRDTTGPVPAQEIFAGDEPWYENNEPITLEGYRYIKYGYPRVLDQSEVGWIGMHRAIRVYAERGSPPIPHVLYLPVAPGTYQPYVSDQAPMCQRPGP